MYEKLKKDFFEGKSLKILLSELTSPSRSMDDKRHIMSYIEDRYVSIADNFDQAKLKLNEEGLPKDSQQKILAVRKTARDMATELINFDSINGIADIDKVFNQHMEEHRESVPV